MDRNKRNKRIKDVIEPRSKCMQMNTELAYIEGEEDCLYLNVFSRKLPEESSKNGNNLLPVFVYIHGGAFAKGDTNPQQIYGPDILMNKKIVLVTFNFRLGVLGLLSTGTKHLPGNLSLKDQLFVLQWVQQNIANFGGDPNKVTLFGQSSGSASVHYHMMSPLSKGLFHRAITMSGTAMNPWAYMTKHSAEMRVKFVAEYLECPIQIGEKIVNCLKEVDGDDLVRALSLYKEDNIEPISILRPIAEEDGSPMRFLYDTPYELIRQGKVMDIPWLNGYNSNEGLTFHLILTTFNGNMKKAMDDVNNVFPFLMDYKYTAKNHSMVTEEIIKHHYHGKWPTEENVKDFSEMITHRGFFQGIYDSFHPLLETNHTRKSPIYLYRVSRAPKIQSSILRIFTANMHSPNLGVAHSEDVPFLFKLHIPILFEDLSTPDEVATSENMVDAFVQFAVTGNPNIGLSKIWKPLISTFEYIDMCEKMSLRKDFPLKSVRFYFSLNIEDGGR